MGGGGVGEVGKIIGVGELKGNGGRLNIGNDEK